jgi:hypothetical protein
MIMADKDQLLTVGALALAPTAPVSSIYPNALRQLLAILEVSIEAGNLYDLNTFYDVVELVFKKLDFSIAELCKDEQVNSGAVSKWINRKTEPPLTTRKIVIAWIMNAAKRELATFEASEARKVM